MRGDDFSNRFLKFHHVFNNIYQEELIYEKTGQNARKIGDVFAAISEELDAFVDFLNGL